MVKAPVRTVLLENISWLQKSCEECSLFLGNDYGGDLRQEIVQSRRNQGFGQKFVQRRAENRTGVSQKRSTELGQELVQRKRNR